MLGVATRRGSEPTVLGEGFSSSSAERALATELEENSVSAGHRQLSLLVVLLAKPHATRFGVRLCPISSPETESLDWSARHTRNEQRATSSIARTCRTFAFMAYVQMGWTNELSWQRSVAASASPTSTLSQPRLPIRLRAHWSTARCAPGLSRQSPSPPASARQSRRGRRLSGECARSAGLSLA